MMQTFHHIDALRQALGGAGRCALVPTMGNLHDGHLALVAAARAQGGPVVTTLFVNRLQFGPHEDFDTYPRTLEQDLARLREAGCNIAFAPSETELYPQPQTCRVQPDPALADVLEGQFRPGFFTGVCTVVMKLFQIAQPAVAVFGQKDYQQLAVLRHMVAQLALPIQILGLPTQRDPDGLALSSRNAYLRPDERARAVALIQALRRLGEQARECAARTDDAQWPSALQTLEQRATAELDASGWQTDYLTVRQRDDLQPPSAARRHGPWVVLGASRLGRTRLIDNVEL